MARWRMKCSELAKLGVEKWHSRRGGEPAGRFLLAAADFGAGLVIVTPGVRPEWAAANDQQRTLTPAAAIAAGADYLVIGRPITAHANPAEAARKIADEIAG